MSEAARLLHLTDLAAASPLLHPDDSIQPQLGLLSQCLCASILTHCHQSARCAGEESGKIKPESTE